MWARSSPRSAPANVHPLAAHVGRRAPQSRVLVHGPGHHRATEEHSSRGARGATRSVRGTGTLHHRCQHACRTTGWCRAGSCYRMLQEKLVRAAYSWRTPHQTPGRASVQCCIRPCTVEETCSERRAARQSRVARACARTGRARSIPASVDLFGLPNSCTCARSTGSRKSSNASCGKSTEYVCEDADKRERDRHESHTVNASSSSRVSSKKRHAHLTLT
jgi:hypothetical protein